MRNGSLTTGESPNGEARDEIEIRAGRKRFRLDINGVAWQRIRGWLGWLLATVGSGLAGLLAWGQFGPPG